jgi:hypothetical protein
MVSEIVGGHDWYELYLNITEVDKLPALEARPNSKVHVLHRGPVLPPSGLINRGNAPHASGSWMKKTSQMLKKCGITAVTGESIGCELISSYR